MKITWLGQGGFIVTSGEKRLVIDPYLSNSLAKTEGLQRLYPPPVEPAQLNADMIICTHNHADHCDLPTLKPLFALENPPIIAGPAPVIEEVTLCGFRQELTTILEPGCQLTLDSLEITAVPALHGNCAAVGLMLHDESGTLYISGDSEYEGNLASQIVATAEQKPEAAIICINGRWGNMNALAAAVLASQLKVKLAVPMHYDLFAENSADPQVFIDACCEKDIKAITLDVSRQVSLAGLLGKAHWQDV